MLNEHDHCPDGMGIPRPGELWSFWDMVKLLKAADLADAGDQCRLVRLILADGDTGKKISPDDQKLITEGLYKMAACCQSLEEPALADLLTDEMSEDHNEHSDGLLGRWDVLESGFWKATLKKQLYYVERSHHGFLDADGTLVTDAVRKRFPTATSELIQAGKAFCFGLHDAAVFHSMRAVEIGARSLAVELKCEFPHPIEQTDFHPLLEACEAKINKLKQLPKSQTKAADLEFYSMAASNFRYFKDGWRIRSVHGRASFQQLEAERVLTRTLEFFEVIAKRLSEFGDIA